MTGEQLTELVRSFDRMRPETVRVQGVGTEKAAKTEDGKGSEDDRDFVIQFSAFRPVVFEARDGKLRLGLRGDRFESEGRKLTRPLQITAVYRPVRGPNGWYFELEGKAEVDFPGRKKLSVGEVALRTTIQRKLADKFPERILDRALPLPDRLRAVGPLAVQHLDANNGWLTVAFD